jgi:hypothetical protein
MSNTAVGEPVSFGMPRRPQVARLKHARPRTLRGRRRPRMLIGVRPSVLQFVVPLLPPPAEVEELWFITRFVGIVAPSDDLESLLIGDPR